uniref:Uncharacterized protein n=1 Tax=Panagrolaimus sp. JU765 TaxID=591449 RepID=A0AC34Q8D7_9BILA
MNFSVFLVLYYFLLANATPCDRAINTSWKTVEVVVVNEDDHPIQFQFCQDICQKKYMINPGDNYVFETEQNDPKPLIWKAWFNGISAKPWNMTIWETGDQGFRYFVRKDDAIYRSELDGSNKMVFIKFAII